MGKRSNVIKENKNFRENGQFEIEINVQMGKIPIILLFNLYLRLGEHPQNKPKVKLLRRLFEIDERTSTEKKSIEFVESKELYEYILLQKF